MSYTCRTSIHGRFSQKTVTFSRTSRKRPPRMRRFLGRECRFLSRVVGRGEYFPQQWRILLLTFCDNVATFFRLFFNRIGCAFYFDDHVHFHTFIHSSKQFMNHFIYFNSCLQDLHNLCKRNLFMEPSFKARTNTNRQTETASCENF